MPVHQPAWQARTSKTRSDIVDSALALFDAGGFDSTTIEQIAESAGIGRRTFFRYFQSKEAVLFSEFTARQQRVMERLRGRPDGEAPLESLIVVLRSMCEEPIDGKRVEALRRIVAGSPALRERQQRVFVDDFPRDLTHILAERAASAASVGALYALVTSALGCIEVATMSHLRHPRKSVRVLFDEAVEVCRSSWSALE